MAEQEIILSPLQLLLQSCSPQHGECLARTHAAAINIEGRPAQT
jgi:hypothetical protein